MAVIIYSNGLTEDYRPSNLVFTEEELVSLFTEFREIRTVRSPSLVNTWVLYGIGDVPDPMNYNKLTSDIIREHVYSHAMFVHDSEIDPKWNATDTILYKGYNEFITELKKIIDEVSLRILSDFEANGDYDNKVNRLPVLMNLGATQDKRLLFSFNPDEQSPDFYKNEEFYRFSQKIYDFLLANKQDKEPFTIFADKKAVIIIDPMKVKSFLTAVLEKFKSREEYEICNYLTQIMKDWSIITDKPEQSVEPEVEIKRPRRRKTKTSDEKTNEQQ